MHLTLSNWNALYKELLRWQTLLEKSTLTKHIPYSRGTGLLYADEQERMQGQTRREGCSQHQAKGGRHRKPSRSKSSDEEQEESSDTDQHCSAERSPWGSSKCCWATQWRELLSCGSSTFDRYTTFLSLEYHISTPVFFIFLGFLAKTNIPTPI